MKRVLVTRSRSQSGQLIQALEDKGFQPELLPLLDIVPLDLPEQTALDLVGVIRSADCLIAISANAARYALPLLQRAGVDDISLFAIGPSTAQVLKNAGYSVQIPEKDFNSEAMLELSYFSEIAQKSVVILCGRGGRDYLETRLDEMEAQVNRVELYERVPRSQDQMDLSGMKEPDILTAMSGDTAKALSEILVHSDRTEWKQLPLVVPGIRVADIASESGFSKVVVSPKPTTDSLLFTLGQLAEDV